jgi:hypothetical protein
MESVDDLQREAEPAGIRCLYECDRLKIGVRRSDSGPRIRFPTVRSDHMDRGAHRELVLRLANEIDAACQVLEPIEQLPDGLTFERGSVLWSDRLDFQKWGANLAHRLEMRSLASVEVIDRSSEAMMSGSACEARM